MPRAAGGGERRFSAHCHMAQSPAPRGMAPLGKHGHIWPGSERHRITATRRALGGLLRHTVVHSPLEPNTRNHAASIAFLTTRRSFNGTRSILSFFRPPAAKERAAARAVHASILSSLRKIAQFAVFWLVVPGKMQQVPSSMSLLCLHPSSPSTQ